MPQRHPRFNYKRPSDFIEVSDEIEILSSEETAGTLHSSPFESSTKPLKRRIVKQSAKAIAALKKNEIAVTTRRRTNSRAVGKKV